MTDVDLRTCLEQGPEVLRRIKSKEEASVKSSDVQLSPRLLTQSQDSCKMIKALRTSNIEEL